jgi:hypothetical protein
MDETMLSRNTPRGFDRCALAIWSALSMLARIWT